MQVGAPSASRVFFDPPVFGQINPQPSANDRANITYQEINDLCRKMRSLGYDKGAIVTRRKLFSNGKASTYEMSQYKNWGFVEDLRSYSVTGQEYFPFKIKWVEGKSTDEWPEALMLIHPSMDYRYWDKQFELELGND